MCETLGLRRVGSQKYQVLNDVDHNCLLCNFVCMYVFFSDINLAWDRQEHATP